MKIKNLENAEELPMKSSMRKSSGYDSWECVHYRDRGIYAWTRAFVEKNVGNTFDSAYSVYKKSLSKKHLSQKDYDEMVWYFKTITNYNEYRYKIWPNEVYVDEDGILRKVPRKTKSRDVTFRYGEPVTKYEIKSEYREIVFGYLAISFGYKKACSMIKNGITEKEYLTETNEVRRFNNLMFENDVTLTRYDWRRLYWTELWWGYKVYPYTETLKYRSREYYKYWYERQDATRKYLRERYQELIDKFNRCELQHSEHPFLIE